MSEEKTITDKGQSSITPISNSTCSAPVVKNRMHSLLTSFGNNKKNEN